MLVVMFIWNCLTHALITRGYEGLTMYKVIILSRVGVTIEGF
jgi:hypothetical protein